MTSWTATEGLPIPNSQADARTLLEQRFHHLLSEYVHALARIAGAYSRVPSDREDILQEVAVAIWQALPGFRNECSETTFVFRIAHNRAVSWLARNGKYRITENELVELADAGPGVEAAVLQQEEHTILSQAVRMLPVVYRQVVVLTLEGLSYSEIADILGISEANVGARLTRARQILRRLLDERK